MDHFEEDWKDFDFLTGLRQKNIVRYISDGNFLFQKIIEAFPITAYRIDWDLIPHMVHHIDEAYPQSKEVIQQHLSALIQSENIDPGCEVFVCFDGSTKGALAMPVKILLDNAGEIFAMPQHTYVIPENVGWCINYTFEDFLYFGHSPRIW